MIRRPVVEAKSKNIIVREEKVTLRTNKIKEGMFLQHNIFFSRRFIRLT